MVYLGRRCWRSREEVPREFREHRSLERSFWGTSHFYRIHIAQDFTPDFFTETFGACAQEDCLWVADPKAINHILQKSGYLYAKPSNIQEGLALVGDRGILWADGELPAAVTPDSSNSSSGDIHKRHRRAMAPAFGLVEAKGLLPYFMDSVTKAREPRPHLISNADPASAGHQMADKWSSVIKNGNSGHSAVIDVNAWLGKATLDACVSVLVFDVYEL